MLFSLDPLPVTFLIRFEGQNDISTLFASRHAFPEVLPRRFQIQEGCRHPQLDDARAPIGEIEECVKVFLHEGVFIPLEVAP